jgi:hypothetical protein
MLEMEHKLNVVHISKYNELQETNERAIAEIRNNHEQIAELQKDIRKLKSEIFALKQGGAKPHNERGAGRKELDINTVEHIHKLKNENITIKGIQTKLKDNGIIVSIGAIHKQIQKLKNEQTK